MKQYLHSFSLFVLIIVVLIASSVNFTSSLIVTEVQESSKLDTYNAISDSGVPINSYFKRYMELKFVVFEVEVDQARIKFDVEFTFLVLMNTNLSININYRFRVSPLNVNSLKLESYRDIVKLSVEEELEANVIIQFKNNFRKGYLLKLHISGELRSRMEGSSFSISPYLDLYLSSDLITSILSVPHTFSILGLNPSAHQIIKNNRSNMYQWNYPYRQSLNYTATYEYNTLRLVSIQTNSYKNSISKGDTISITSVINNSGSIPINLVFSIPNWFIIEINNYPFDNNNFEMTIERKSVYTIEFKSNKTLGLGRYTGKIYISYENTIIEEIEVNFKIIEDDTLTSIIVFSVIVAFILILLTLANRYKNSIMSIALDKKFFRSKYNISVDEIKQSNNMNPRSEHNLVQPNMYNEKSNPAFKSRTNIDFAKLNKFMTRRELKVIKFLDNNKGTTQQSLADHLELSKATVSRLLNILEAKNLIVRVKIGMSNNVYIKYHSFIEFFYD